MKIAFSSVETDMDYRIAGMFGRVNVRQTTKLKVAGKKTFGEWINFGQKETDDELKFGWSKFGEPQTIRQICRKLSHCQTFPLYGVSYIAYYMCCTLYIPI